MDVTCIIKTFERPHICQRLVDSILSKYKDMLILVADDSKEPSEFPGATTFTMPFDSGLSAGRNFLLRKVKTKYFVLLDDDWIFTDKTKLEEFVQIFQGSNLDILAGIIKGEKRSKHFYGTIQKQGHVLRTRVKPYSRGQQFTRCDYTHNFFIAEVATILKYPWDEELKLNEHMEFFLRVKGKLKVAYTNLVQISEKGFRGGTYGKFRARNFFALAMKKHGIRVFHNQHGNTFTYDS